MDLETTILAPEDINRKNLPGILSIQGVSGPTGFSHVQNQKRKSNRRSPHFSKSIPDDETQSQRPLPGKCLNISQTANPRIVGNPETKLDIVAVS
jgi:hypothetical protein